MTTAILPASGFVFDALAGNNLAYMYDDNVKNVAIYDTKKLKQSGERILQWVKFDSKGGIKKEEMKPLSDKYKLTRSDFLNRLSKSVYYCSIKEGKTMIIGKLTFYTKSSK